MLRSAQVAAGNRRDRQRLATGWFQRQRTWVELRNPPPVHAIGVHRQARRVLMFAAMLIALGSAVSIFA